HRHYDRHGIQPLFPFGHGLGYTSFALGDLVATPDAVQVTLTNTGARPGSTVVQVYVGARAASVPRPVRELKGFAKVTLPPGGVEVVTIPLTPRAFAFFDGTAKAWRVEVGVFDISVGFSALDLPLRAEVRPGAALLPL
ncbi:MAG: fibronectin type III-like domain-contianing protein, partial [Candidatus Saccharibacteria bacterium]|nr:fibronectin type III-like domain-contianing protein [Pseudorhodobacter sp.]